MSQRICKLKFKLFQVTKSGNGLQV